MNPGTADSLSGAAESESRCTSRMSPALLWALLIFAAGAVALQLFVQPVLGVADNGDFGKLSHHACIGPARLAEYPYFDYFETRYAVWPEYCGSIIPSSAVIPVFVAKWISRAAFGARAFDLRVLGAIYGALFLAAFWVLLRRISASVPVAREAVALAIPLVFCTAVYIPLFNTFYMDAFTFVLLAWAVALGVDLLAAPEVRWPRLACYAAVILLLATSKLQYLLLAACLSPLVWFRRGRSVYPGRSVRLAATLAIAAGALWYGSMSSPWYRAITIFDGLFFKFLPACENPSAKLRNLGLGPEFDQYVGKHSYSEGVRMQQEQYAVAFGKRVTLPRFAWFLATHPRAVLRAAAHDLAEASLERVRMKVGAAEYRLGNYERRSGRAPNQQSDFLAFWSDAKGAALARRPALYLSYVLAILAALWTAALLQPVQRGAALLGAFCLTTMLPAIFAPAFLDAVDTGRHLLLFNCVLDVCACALLWMALRAKALRRSRRELNVEAAR